MRQLLHVAVTVLALAALGAAPVPKHLMKEEKVAPAKVVGKWVPKERPELGTVEYTKDGRLVMNCTASENAFVVEGTYKIEDGKLTETLNNAGPSPPRVITKLTDTELVITNAKGEDWVMVRVKDK
ncbi:unnamed protein product [Gemmata massiliana]|uniref:Lipocalin-like domain-containing protein n=1 Tax=Gemmata massiliana TaxID=1210884 RepID=A0A6P2CYP5_9BACT|nr:hypothetical protein [Gemmata massiliana]VTR93245.1 unnamed protein product [Gemmata massiliana]